MSFSIEIIKYIFLSGALFFTLFGILIIFDFTPMRVKERNRIVTSIMCFSVSIVSINFIKIYAFLFIILTFCFNNDNSVENSVNNDISSRNKNIYKSMLENEDEFKRNSNLSLRSGNESINYINNK